MNEFSITPFRGPHLLLLFAVIMDIRPGYVDHRGCVPHAQALWSLNIFVGLDDFGTAYGPFLLVGETVVSRQPDSGTEQLSVPLYALYCIKTLHAICSFALSE